MRNSNQDGIGLFRSGVNILARQAKLSISMGGDRGEYIGNRVYKGRGIVSILGCSGEKFLNFGVKSTIFCNVFL